MTSDYKNMDDKQLLEALNAGYQTHNFKFTYNSKKKYFVHSAVSKRQMQPVSNNGSTFSRRKSRTEARKRAFESSVRAEN